MSKKLPATGAPLSHNPFAGLASKREELPPGVEEAVPMEEGEDVGARGAGPAPLRAVLRLERKGRGGKDATIVEKLALNGDELGRWLKELKAALGCGGAVEGENLAFQGDQRERLGRLLLARGVRKVIRG